MRLVGLALALGALGGVAYLTRRPAKEREDRFAGALELRSMIRRRRSGQGIALGRLASQRWRATRHELETVERDSVMILGPTRSGKTSSLVVPALLDWEGPVLAASVKDDLVTESAARRQQIGRIGVFDPSFSSGSSAITFDPVSLSSSWAAARRVGSSLMASSMDDGGPSDAQFWSQLAAKAVAPLLLAAAEVQEPLSSVVQWVDRRDEYRPLGILEAAGHWGARDALAASFQREERQLSSILATIEAALEPLHIDGTDDARCFDPEVMLVGSETLYLCAPAHDQHRYRSAFTAMTNELLHAAFSLARRQGGSLERPLLVVLDEAAAIAPIKELDVIAATCASHGITLVTCFQDIAQIRARYGERWATVVNNHRTRIFLSGLADPNVSEVLGSLTGEIAGPAPRSTVKGSPAFSSPRRRLIEPHDLRVLPSFRGIVISGSLPPFRLALVPWWKSERRQPRGAEVPAGYAGIRDHLRRLRPPVVDRPHPTGRPDQGREPRPSR